MRCRSENAATYDVAPSNKFLLNSVSVPELLEEWDGRGWDGGRDGLDVGVDVGEFLVGHNLAAVWRHVAWTGIADVGSKGRKGQLRLGQARAGEPALAN